MRHLRAVHLALADALPPTATAPRPPLPATCCIDWLAAEARAAAIAGAARARLASANELWDKADALFADAEEYNLDARQTLIAIFDAIEDTSRDTRPPRPSHR